jgi:hypothetical protein
LAQCHANSTFIATPLWIEATLFGPVCLPEWPPMTSQAQTNMAVSATHHLSASGSSASHGASLPLQSGQFKVLQFGVLGLLFHPGYHTEVKT